MNRKGQSLSLNVIIIAILALIVLVVLVAIFTGQIGQFQLGVSKTGEPELVQMRIQYGPCQPTTGNENAFLREFNQAGGDEATKAGQQDAARSDFQQKIAACTHFTEQSSCTSNGCLWK